MNLQSQSVTAALALYPVYLPQWVTPVQPAGTADGGLPQAAFAPAGVEIVIEPFTALKNWTMAPYDVVTIYINNVSTGVSKTIYPGEENDRFLLLVSASWFVNGVNEIFYRVKRVSGNSDDSLKLKVLYHDPIAGYPAPTGITVAHPASVGPGQTGALTITISFARPYDTVTLTIGTWSITFTNTDHTKPITHTLTAAELPQIGDGTHPVRARVVDQLTNSNVSATTSITITANQKVLNPPIIFEANPGNVLDVPALNGKDATIHGQSWTGIAVGQQVWLKVTGQKPGGSTVIVQIWNGGASKVNATWISQGFWPKPLPVSFLSQLADGSSLLMEFWVSEEKSDNFATATKFPDQVYTVKALTWVSPTIDSVKANSITGAEIPIGSTTSATTFVLIGKANASQTVELLDNGLVKDTIKIDPSGNYSHTVTRQATGLHSYTVRANYGNFPESTPWFFTVHESLIVDPSPLVLSGRNYSIEASGLNWVRTGVDPAGTTGRKTISGGKPPYTYSSSSAIASVDDTGLVRSEGNGQAIITVRDSDQNVVTFEVHTSNVKQILVNHQQLSAAQAASWIASVGATQITSSVVWPAFSTAVRAKYKRGPGFVMEHYFTGEKYGTMSWAVAAVAHDAHPEGWIYLTYSAIATQKTMCEK